MKIIELEEVDSTNEYCKREDNGEDMIVVAKRQTEGKGTKGRSFSSRDGGLYVSVMRHFEDFAAVNAFVIMVSGCVAVCKTLEEFGIKPVVRWANDVLVGGRKISGTLIENTFSGGKIKRSILGTGINVNNILPCELSDVAVSMREINNGLLPYEKVRETFCRELVKNYTIDDYKRYIDWFGKQIILKTAFGERQATALDVEQDGSLVVSSDGKIEKISSAEVSLRFRL